MFTEEKLNSQNPQLWFFLYFDFEANQIQLI